MSSTQHLDLTRGGGALTVRAALVAGGALAAGGLIVRAGAAETSLTALPVGALLACALLAAVLGIGGWAWSWLTTASPRGATRFAARAAALGGASALALAGLSSWLGAATVVLLPALYLVAAGWFWVRRAR
jgi:hypothetical protein